MPTNKSQEDPILRVFIASLCDVSTLHSDVFGPRALKLTINKIVRRYAHEGASFLTKTLARHGKAFDKALTGEYSFILPRERKLPGSKLPKLFGELYEQVFDYDGRVRSDACPNVVRSIRQLLYLFYKYELPYHPDDEQRVLFQFVKTEEELVETSANLVSRCKQGGDLYSTMLRARKYIYNVLWQFDPYDIHPRHGPGAVSTKEQLWTKYSWTNIPDRLSRHFPIDAYFYASLGHVCDEYREINSIGKQEDFARVILVPKDSRGPRLISAEPLVNQWIQQGISRALVRHVERHSLTRNVVNFTDQRPNAQRALAASNHGEYSTLDLNEASDRVLQSVVKLLFPKHVYDVLCACRSQGTILPNGDYVPLVKHAPMGSALCFPILALTIWALLRATDIDDLLVYGDDVIVPTPKARDAITTLESFGLKVNRDKSCTSGLFRESCGMDAFKGIDVTPVRIRTVWKRTPSPDVYTSWISYANSFHERRFVSTYGAIAEELNRVYGYIPVQDSSMSYPGLRGESENDPRIRTRYNPNYQRFEKYVRVVYTPRVRKTLPGWKMLLRFFSEADSSSPCWVPKEERHVARCTDRFNHLSGEAFSVRVYTKRKTSKLVWRWR